jgi:excisionase family DNA binding protein
MIFLEYSKKFLKLLSNAYNFSIHISHVPSLGDLMIDDELLTLKEAAKILKVSTRTLFTWLQRGDLTGHKAGRAWRIRRSAIERFLDERPGRKAETARGAL